MATNLVPEIIEKEIVQVFQKAGNLLTSMAKAENQ